MALIFSKYYFQAAIPPLCQYQQLKVSTSLPYGSEAHFLPTATRGRSRLSARSVLLSLRLRGLHRRPAPSFPELPLSKNSPEDTRALWTLPPL